MSTETPQQYNTLIEALEALLPDILKEDVPQKGDELIEKMRDKVGFRWEPMTIRYHLTILSTNPSSCVAKYYDENGKRRQGFVLRPVAERHWGKDKQKMAHKALVEATRLLSALSVVGVSPPSYWNLVHTSQHDLKEALANFNTCK